MSSRFKNFARTNLHNINSLWEFHTTFILRVVFLKPGLVECKDYCFDPQVYKAYKMNYIDDRNVSFYQQFEIFKKLCVKTLFAQYILRALARTETVSFTVEINRCPLHTRHVYLRKLLSHTISFKN